MRDIADKVNGVNVYQDVEFNSIKNEQRNLVLNSGQTLSAADDFQINKAVSTYVAHGAFYTDTGAANNYVLTPIGTINPPFDYVDGMKIRFVAANTNTTSCQVNAGSLGVKPLKDISGSDLIANVIVAGEYYEAIYNLAADEFFVSYSTIAARQRSLINYFINPDFRFAQRQKTASLVDTNQYVLDRWLSATGSNGECTISRQPVTVGDKLPGGSGTFTEQYFYRHEQTVAATTSPLSVQRIEDVRFGDDNTVTVSFYARLNSGTTNVTINAIQRFGVGGSPDVVVLGTPMALTPSFERYEQTITLPSISGKTIGTDHYVEIDISYDIGVTFQVDLRRAKINFGPEATEFQSRPLGEEITLCQRYYSKSYDIESDPGSLTLNGTFNSHHHQQSGLTRDFTIKFPVTMRDTPSTQVYSGTTGVSGQWRNVTGGSDVAASFKISSLGESYGTVEVTGNLGGTGTIANVAGHWTADAEL